MAAGEEISGGYYIKARSIKYSPVMTAPPYIREIWDWILKEANHQDTITATGLTIFRGQLARSYSDIQEGLHWRIGFSKKTYSKRQCQTAVKWLKDAKMIATKKSTRLLIITVVNYDFFQNPQNYETNKKPAGQRTTGKTAPDFMDQVIESFCQAHGSYTVVNKGKERTAAGKIVKLYREKYPKATTEETTEGLKAYFLQCCNIKNDWLKTNMSLSLICSRFNEINQELKNGTHRKNNGATPQELAEIVGRKFAADSPDK